MSRQEATNTFTEGLIMDLNPITTPNNVLTDCLNGTMITYDGNEFVLQNDQGNYKLPYGSLNSNFIPVGIREYGGILYIVSFNPVDKLCEIGSYPSPQTIFDDSELNEVKDIQYIELSIGDNNYTELSVQKPIEIYSISDNFYLNPGDKYYVTSDILQSDKRYQTLEFYVLNSEKELFEVSEFVEVHNTGIEPTLEDFDNVNWKIPGWLAFKFRVAELESFNLYLTDWEQPLFSTTGSVTLKYGIQCQIITNDFLFNTPHIEGYLWNDLKVRIKYTILDKDGNTISNSNYSTFDVSDVKYTNINQFYFTNEINRIGSDIIINNSQNAYKIVFTAVPILNAESGKVIVYDQFETTLDVLLFDVRDFEEIIVFDTYKYLVSDQDVTLNYNINAGVAQISELEVTYKLHKVIPNADGTFNTPLVDAGKLLDSNFLGQNITSLSFTNRTSGENENLTKLLQSGTNPVLNTSESITGNFTKEDIYIFTLKIYSKSDNTNVKEFSQFLIASELMNIFYSQYDHFKEISLYEWMSEMPKYMDYSKYEVDYEKKDSEILINNLPTDNFEEYVLRDEQLSNNELPSLGIKSKIDINVNNLNQPTLFNNIGIWKDLNLDFILSLTTSEEELIFKNNETTYEYELSEYNYISFLQELISYKKWSREYLYDYCFCQLPLYDKRRENPNNSWDLMTRYTCAAYGTDEGVYQLFSYTSEKSLAEGYEFTNQVGDKLELRGQFSKDIARSIINKTYSDLRYGGLFQLINFTGAGRDGEESGRDFWNFSNDFGIGYGYRNGMNAYGLNFIARIDGEYQSIILPFVNKNIFIEDQHTDDYSALKELSAIADQMSLHIYTVKDYRIINKYLLDPIDILQEYNNQLDIEKSKYDWTYNSLLWGGHDTSIENFNIDNLNFSSLVDRNNLKNGEQVTTINSNYESDVNLRISVDFGEVEWDGEIYNIDQLGTYLNGTYLQLKNANLAQKIAIEKEEQYVQYRVYHDLEEIGITSGNVKDQYDNLVNVTRANTGNFGSNVVFYLQNVDVGKIQYWGALAEQLADWDPWADTVRYWMYVSNPNNPLTLPENDTALYNTSESFNIR